VSDQIEFSSFYRLLNSIKEGDTEKISLLDQKVNEFKEGLIAKNYLEELGYLYLSIGITELYNYTNKNDLTLIGLLEKDDWENLSIANKEELPVFLANKMIEYIKKNKKTKDISKKWKVREGEVKKHITQMARYITEGIIDVIE
tara:strand:+ start:591 stop:1022 length:432 start_codon:yes stop_codon:yes gene_type:complete